MLSTIDFGAYGPEGDQQGVVGYGGGIHEPAVINEHAATRCYSPSRITPGQWGVKLGQFIDLGWRSLLPHWFGCKRKIQCEVNIELRTKPTLAPDNDRSPYRPPTTPLIDHAGRYFADFHTHSEHSGDSHSTGTWTWPMGKSNT